MAESEGDLVQRGIAAIRAGQSSEGRRLLAQALQINPRNELAWLWMSSVVQTAEQRIHCLKQVLAINPQNEVALKGLRSLGVLEAPPSAQPAAPPPSTQPAPPVQAPDGIPLIEADTLAWVQREAEPILRSYRNEIQAGKLNVAWAMPAGQAGPAIPRVRRMRIDPMMVAVGGSVVIVVLVVVLVVNLARLIGARQRAGGVAVVPTATPAETAYPTLTPRPTRTPTPTGQPLVPEPSLAVGDAPRGDLRYGLTPTPPYIATPHPSSPVLNSGITAFYEGRYQEAIDLIRQARAGGDTTIDSYFFEGMALAYLNDLDGASQVIQGAIRQDETFAPLHAALGYVYAQRGLTEQARLENEQAKLLDPNLIMAYLNLAQIYLDEGDYDSALAEVQAARRIRKYDVNLLVMEGRIYLASGRPQDATAVANLAYYIDPSSEAVVLLLGSGRLALGLYERAVIGLEDHLEQVNPSSAEVWALLGRAYGKQGRTADALQAYERALQLAEDTAEALIGRGTFYLDEGRYDLAYADFDQALRRDANNYGARYGRAVSGLATGEIDHLLEDITYVREQSPGQPDIETLYVRALIENGLAPETIEAATAALELGLDPTQMGFVLEARGRAYYRQNELENALADIEQALTLQETGTRHYYRGLIRKELGNVAGAILDLEWVLFWNQVYEYPFAEEAQAQLEALYAVRDNQRAEATATAEASITPTATSTPTATATLTPSPSPTATLRPSPTPTSTPTPRPSPTPTLTPTRRPTSTPTP
jgi:tetratricopeptide (TPR) repeat protein